MNKKITITLLCTIIFLSNLSVFAVIVKIPKPIKKVNSITLNNYGNLYITQGNKNTLRIQTEANNLQNIEVSDKNDSLILSVKNHDNEWWDIFNLFSTEEQLNYYLTIEHLNNLDINSSGKVVFMSNLITTDLRININESGSFEADNITADTIVFKTGGSGNSNIYEFYITNNSAITINGNGNLLINTLTSNNANIKISDSGKTIINKLITNKVTSDIAGSGKLILSGMVNSQKISISGSGNYYAKHLKSLKADINSTGNSAITISVDKLISVNLHGSGGLEVYGDPKITFFNVSGSEEVKFHH